MEHQNPRVTAQGHQTVMPYLILEGTNDFIAFARKVFFMELQLLTPRKKDQVMHAELRTEGSTIMVADATEEWPAIPCSLFIYVDDTDETYQLALQEGAVSMMEPTDQSYGRAAGFKDAWGNVWWLASLP